MTYKKLLLAITTLVLSVLAAACNTSQPTATAPQAAIAVNKTPKANDAQPTKTHSPYMLKLTEDNSDPPFNVISFKDVGIADSGENSELLYETLAESLALEMSIEPAKLYSEVVHEHAAPKDEEQKPGSCGQRHIYVDVWSTDAPRQWGYSLWSGCSEADQFAWQELPRPKVEAASIEDLKPLAEDIARALKDAARTGCFQREC